MLLDIRSLLWSSYCIPYIRCTIKIYLTELVILNQIDSIEYDRYYVCAFIINYQEDQATCFTFHFQK